LRADERGRRRHVQVVLGVYLRRPSGEARGDIRSASSALGGQAASGYNVNQRAAKTKPAQAGCFCKIVRLLYPTLAIAHHQSLR
jgi:hypothetical protein